MKLIIVESPTKAKTITQYLNKEFEVRASVGHIRDLPKSNKNAIDIENGFIPHYEIPKEKKPVVHELITLSKKASEVILATDPDREGEAIAWHIQQACDLKNPKRIAFHEITEHAILDALKHPRTIDDNLRKAQEARRVLDRLFGYDLSGLLWTKLRYGLSAGRVQSPALRILVEREREIQAFIPEKFWIINATFQTEKKEMLSCVYSKNPTTQAEADSICTITKNASWTIGDVKETEVARSPKAPFTTSTLQQSASSRYGLSPSITMRAAQKLYEAGLITYMRTDSTNISSEAQQSITQYIKKTFGDTYSAPRIYKTKTKNAQEAHEAIRPTKIQLTRAGKTAQEQKVYELIWHRTIASQMSDARTMRTTITVVDSKKEIEPYIAQGSRIVFDGWIKGDPHSRGEEVEVPKVTKKEKVVLSDIDPLEKQTEPPHRYSEAGLIKELEKRGIGRPSTYATIIKTIIDRGYVQKEQRSLKPTETGEVVSEFLEKNFTQYISDSFTAEMENELDEIASGNREYTKTLKDFYKPFTEEIKKKKSIPKITNLGEAPHHITCPLCNGPMIIKLSRSGRFYSCAKFPECTGARTSEGKILEAPKDLGKPCPRCGKPLIEREGRFGSFIACSNYPKCKYTERTENEDPSKSTGVHCPICKKGTMVERRGRFGVFYSCSQYPECKHIIKSKPTGDICNYPRENGPCIHLLMEGTKTIPVRCSDKTCPNHNPHKLEKNTLSTVKKKKSV